MLVFIFFLLSCDAGTLERIVEQQKKSYITWILTQIIVCAAIFFYPGSKTFRFLSTVHVIFMPPRSHMTSGPVFYAKSSERS